MSRGPSCPECQETKSLVKDSRTRGGAYEKWRRRVCVACGHTFTTLERVQNDIRGPLRDRRVLRHFWRVLEKLESAK